MAALVAASLPDGSFAQYFIAGLALKVTLYVLQGVYT